MYVQRAWDYHRDHHDVWITGKVRWFDRFALSYDQLTAGWKFVCNFVMCTLLIGGHLLIMDATAGSVFTSHHSLMGYVWIGYDVLASLSLLIVIGGSAMIWLMEADGPDLFMVPVGMRLHRLVKKRGLIIEETPVFQVMKSNRVQRYRWEEFNVVWWLRTHPECKPEIDKLLADPTIVETSRFLTTFEERGRDDAVRLATARESLAKLVNVLVKMIDDRDDANERAARVVSDQKHRAQAEVNRATEAAREAAHRESRVKFDALLERLDSVTTAHSDLDRRDSAA